MYKKIISSILVISFLNLLGCHSFKSVTVPEYKQIEENEDKPDEIYVITKDDQEYHFSDSNFYIENDTLYGKGILIDHYKRVRYKSGYNFDKKIALSNIESIDAMSSYWVATSFLILGIGAISVVVLAAIVKQ